jgi:hypothetical protein
LYLTSSTGPTAASLEITSAEAVEFEVLTSWPQAQALARTLQIAHKIMTAFFRMGISDAMGIQTILLEQADLMAEITATLLFARTYDTVSF